MDEIARLTRVDSDSVIRTAIGFGKFLLQKLHALELNKCAVEVDRARYTMHVFMQQRKVC